MAADYAHASRMREGRNHVITGSRQMGHCSILAEQELQAHKCPHGIATCDFGRVKQMTHVVSPPRVDSGTAGRPVSNLASARETAGTEALIEHSVSFTQPSCVAVVGGVYVSTSCGGEVRLSGE